MLAPLPDSFVATRDGLHALAEHVIAPARYRADGHISLVATSGGFGTPTFGDGERVRVDGVELVHERPGTSTRVGITTLSVAAQFVGVPLGAPVEVYTPATPCEPDAPLGLDSEAAGVLAAWIDLGDSILAELRESYATRQPTAVALWPEHFDLACQLGDVAAGTRANYGASPGDAVIAQPYLYVGPFEPRRRTGKLATYSWGSAITYEELAAAGDSKGAGIDFFLEGAALLLGQP
ncbi:MAG: hypothetical protein QOF59_2277 [Actinomycetota bacterium]|jgi:hypothetical protein|nr:hypothetical protein [Actinomycetota bacterium]MDQ1477221.1 hypothetical protein [Actinomycetota bacterium]